MSIFQQVSHPFAHYSPPSTTLTVEALTLNFPLLKDLLTCQPENILPNINKLSELPEEELKNQLKKYSTVEQFKISSFLLDQLKKVINWNIDHMILFNQFTKISKSFWLDVSKFYMELILAKIQNGLHFIQIYEKAKDIPVRGMHERVIPTGSTAKTPIKQIQNSYKVMNTQTLKNDPDYALYYKRCNGLTDQQKLKYRLKLIQHLIFIPQAENHRPYLSPWVPHRQPLGGRPRRSNFDEDLNRVYETLSITQYDWLLEELLKIDCPKTQEYKKIINSLRLIKDHQENVKLEVSPKIRSKQITQNVLKVCMKVENEDESTIFRPGSYLQSNGTIYLKHDISELLKVSLDYIATIRMIRQMSNSANINQEKIRMTFINILTKIYPIIQNITLKKPILVYKNQQFVPIQEEKASDTLLFCLKMIEKIIQIGKILKCNKVVDQILANSQHITHVSQIMTYILTKNQLKKNEQILCLICSNLQDLLLRKQEKLALMNDKCFLELFTQCLNAIICNVETKIIPAKIESFIISYIPTLFQFGLEIQRIKLQKIYQLKLNNLSNQNINMRAHLRARMNIGHEQMLRMGQIDGKDNRSTLQQFIQVFPSSIKYFNQKLVEQTADLQNQFQEIDIFDDKIPNKIKYLLKIFANQNIQVNAQLAKIFKKVIIAHPTILLKNASNPNWKILKARLQFTEQQIYSEIKQTLLFLRENKAMEQLLAEQLCQRTSSTDKNLIALLNKISYLHILLKMRQTNQAFPYTKELMELTLHMQRIESTSLNKIVKYQATYRQQKVKQIKALYRQMKSSKMILHYKITEISYDLANTCWDIFAELDLKNFNLFLKEYRLYLEAMKCLDDKNLVLKLLKKVYRSIRSISDKKGYNLFFQFYNYNKDMIYDVLSLLYKQVGDTKGISREPIVMGESYLRFVQINRQQNKDPAVEFNTIIRPHFQHSLEQFLDEMFFNARENNSIFNDKSYSGTDNVLSIVRSMLCDILHKISTKFNIEHLLFYSNFINIIEDKGLKLRETHQPGQFQNTLQIDIPEQNLKTVTKAEKDKSITESYIAILSKIEQFRYNKTEINQLQTIFFKLSQKLAQKYNHPHEQKTLVKIIFNQIGQNSENLELDQEKFKLQCSWIDIVLKKSKNLLIEEVLSQKFIKNYLKLTQKMLNHPQQFKQSLPNSISILEKFIPKNLSQSKEDLITYGRALLQRILKMINCCISFGKINYETVYSIAQTIVQTKCPQFDQQLISLLSILHKGKKQIGILLCQLISKQTQLASMESDIKAVFLRQSENLVDQSQDKISIRLETYINIFKNKYEEQVSTFTNLTSKFLKKNIKGQDKKEGVFLSFEKNQLYSYSQILKRQLIQFEPSSSIKIIIKNLLSFEKINDLKDSLLSFQDLFYYCPLIIPYVMLHPIKTSQGQIEFIDFLIQQISTKRVDIIDKFLLFSCLDHSCIISQNDKSIFFSQYLLYRIIKQIINLGMNKHTLYIIYHLSQLKRFAYLAKLKINKKDKKSLINVMIDYLKSTREGFQYKNSDNNLVYLIMAILFKQDNIDNLKKCFIPKKVKGLQVEYKLINQCLIPYNVYYRRQVGKGVFENRQANIAFTGNLITPYYSEINQDIYMDQIYNIAFPKNYSRITEQEQQIVELSQQRLLDFNLKCLHSIKNEIKYKSTEFMLSTEYNERHKSMMSRIVNIYFKESGQSQQRRPRNIFEEQGRGPQYHRRRPGQMRRYRDRMSRQNRRNQTQNSRYAPEVVNSNNSKQSKKKTIEQEFQKSLNNIPSEQILFQQNSSSNFQDIKTGGEQLQIIIKELNEKLFLISKQPFNEDQLKGKTFLEKKQYLENKQVEIDFDYNKIWLSPEEFQQYCLSNSKKLQILQPKRRQEVMQIQEKIFLLHLQRTPSSDSLGPILQAIQQNYQYLPNIKRTLSRSQSLSNYDQKDQEFQAQPFFFENSLLPIRAFSDINEETIYEMLLSFYYICEAFASKQFMPFLENKKVQNQLINTLLNLMKNPFSNQHFPSCVYKFSETQLKWKRVDIDESNRSIQTRYFIQRVLPVFQSVKNYSFYQNNNFLQEEINNEGILGIQYESSQGNHYIPIYQILQFVFKSQKNVVFEFVNGIKTLPSPQIQKLLQIIQKSQTQTFERQDQHVFVMGRVFARPLTKTKNPTPYENLKELFNDQNFMEKFKQTYKFGVKDPSPALLTHLIQSNIYTRQQLKQFHIKVLQSQPDDPNSYKFLNKIIQIYTDEQIKQANWMKKYQQIFAKTLEYIQLTSKKIEDEPLSRILNLTKDLGFEMKRKMLQKELQQKKRQIYQRHHFDQEREQKQAVICKKQKGVFLSSFEDLRYKPSNFWLSPFKVSIVNESGKKQSGFGDGVKRQWFTLLTKAMVNLDYGFFKRTPQNYYFFNPQSLKINSMSLQFFEFIGKLFAYSLFKKSILVSPSFSIILYKMILEEEITLKDILPEFTNYAERIKGIQRLLNKSNQQITGCCLNFTYYENKLLPDKPSTAVKQTNQSGNSIGSPNKAKIQKTIQIISRKQAVIKQLHTEQEQNLLPNEVNVVLINEIVQLKPGGASIQVNSENIHEYLELTKQKIYQVIVKDVKRQFQAFIEGFKQIIKPKTLSRFTALELRDLFEGTSAIQIEDIQKYTKNRDVDSNTTDLFWRTLSALSNQDRGIFLWFWTGVDKMPMEGARIMGLSIDPARSGNNFIAHTCAKSLQVPRCKSKQEMQTAVNVALNSVKSGYAFISD